MTSGMTGLLALYTVDRGSGRLPEIGSASVYLYDEPGVWISTCRRDVETGRARSSYLSRHGYPESYHEDHGHGEGHGTQRNRRPAERGDARRDGAIQWGARQGGRSAGGRGFAAKQQGQARALQGRG